MTMTIDALLATRDNLDAVVDALQPLGGSMWLVVDRSTHCHWVIEAAAVAALRGSRYGRDTASTGLATVTSPAGSPVFVIESHDNLTWRVPGETLVVQEGRFRGSAIVLHRLDDVDAPTVSAELLNRRLAVGEVLPAIGVRNGRYVEIAECLLPTGDLEIDDELRDIETAIKSRILLEGPSSGTREALNQMDERLNVLGMRPDLESFIWLTMLRETIARLLRSTVAA
ncbi:MAG TPA: hypothetical protein VMM78_02645 [Thermomicrobiales bacterium]|nr:hypothetical protein [Thermomicrobiales bacterium]